MDIVGEPNGEILMRRLFKKVHFQRRKALSVFS
jgi:hypothetical protein